MIFRSSRLIRVVDGVWVRPCDVTSVSAVMGETHPLQTRKPYVCLTRDAPGPDGFVCSYEMLFPCESDAEADALADIIGAMVATLQADDAKEPADG